MRQSKLQAALHWASRGFKVFPLEVNGKHPVVPAFGACASDDPAQIRSWWTCPVTGMELDRNIGVLTTDIVVCDVDVKDGKPGIDTYHGMGGHFETLTVQTPTGGYHCYFMGYNSANTYPGPGLDIRSHNGYVLAPGSTINGVPYTVIVDKPMSWVPMAIEATLRAPGVRAVRDASTELDTPNAITYAQTWLETSAPLAIEGQSGDSTTYQVACKMVRDFALSEETACELMLQHWNDRCSPPWDRDELFHKVENAYAYGTGAVGQALPEAQFAGLVNIPEPPPAFTAPVGLAFGNALDVMHIPPRPWLVPRLLMRRAMTMLIAQGGAGKTTVALAVAAHGAVGQDFGTYKFSSPFKTVFYSAEEDRAELSRRLYAVAVEYKLDWPTVKAGVLLIGQDDFELMLACVVQRQPVQHDDHVNYLLSLATSPDVGLVVLDPFVEVHMCDEQDNAQMKYVMSVLRRICREANVAMLVPHHTPKGSGKEAGSADAARGAGAIVNSARIAMTLFNATDKDREVYGIKEEEKRDFVRLDDAKMNLTLATSESLWFRKVGVKLVNGDEVGVLLTHAMGNGDDAQRRFIALTCAEAIGASNAGAISLQDAVLRLQAADPLYERMSVTTLRARIEKLLKGGVALDDGQIVCEREMQGRTEKVWIKLV